jgi:hypothetical protein
LAKDLNFEFSFSFDYQAIYAITISALTAMYGKKENRWRESAIPLYSGYINFSVVILLFLSEVYYEAENRSIDSRIYFGYDRKGGFIC